MPGYLPASICFFSPSPFGPPAISTKVGNQSRDANSWFLIVPGLITPGHRITQGAPSDRIAWPRAKALVGQVVVGQEFALHSHAFALLHIVNFAFRAGAQAT